MKKFIIPLFFICTSAHSYAQQLAFPEAQGWGRYATGGRKGTVYHVTNLNDSGEGSLRDAVSKKNRIVVFDVAGVINLNSRLTFASDLYVAGQSAPGEGITVYGNGVSFSGATNSIIRYMRFRMGVGGDNGKDCAGIANGTNMIFDHCSFAWGRDETFSINPDGKGDLHSVTIQNCVVGQGLMSHSAGGLMQADKISLIGNFYCDNSTRNNKVKGKNQYVGNVVYNWKDGAYIMGGDSEGQSYCNIQGNLFINGPAGGGDAFTGGNGNFHCYVKDNYQDSNRNGVLDEIVVTKFSGSDVVTKPYDYPLIESIPTPSILINGLKTVGASYPLRDYTDYYMVDEVMSFGKEGALISNEGSLPYGTPNTWKVWKGTNKVDSDKDGMPDAYEVECGFDPQKNDAMELMSDGYTKIEHYLNTLINLGEIAYLRPPMLIELKSATTNSLNIKWRDWTEGEEGFIIEAKTEGSSFVELARTEANTNSLTINKLQPATAYTIRIKAWRSNGTDEASPLYSDYSNEVIFKTLPEEVGVVNTETYEPDLTLTGGNTWNKVDKVWDSADGLYEDGKKVLLSSAYTNTVSVSEDVSPECVVVMTNAEEMMTVNSNGGVITGSTSMNKTGNGELHVKGKHTYTGATVVNNGEYKFDYLTNGGTASSLGASQEFAQNWIFNGGTFTYAGTDNSTTNRSARILKESCFNIAESGRKITLNGKFEGTGNLIFDGKGTFVPNTNKFFSYTGETILKGGTLQLPTPELSNNGIGASKKLVFAGGTLKTAGETEGYENYAFPIEVLEGTTSYFSPNRNCYMKNTVTGTGTLQINIPYVREYIQGNWDGFKGRIIAYANNAGNLFLLSGKNIPYAVIDLKHGVQACGWDTNGNYVLGGLSGEAGTFLSGCSKKTDGFKCLWTIGGANTDETFNGTINNWSCSGKGHVGTVSITKAGTGIWRLNGNNEYSGTTTVNAGRLVINGVNSGNGTITVNPDAELAGNGTVAGNVTIKSSANIIAGDEALVNRNTLIIKGKLTVLKDGMVTIPVYFDEETTKANRIVLSGGASFTNAILNLDIQNVYSTLDIPEGAEFRLFTTTGTVTGTFNTIYPETPGEGKEWDTSDLYKKGILRVKASETSAINAINNDSLSQVSYNLQGIKDTRSSSSKIVITNGKKHLIKR